MIVLAGGDITINGTTTDVELTEWRLLAGPQPAFTMVSSP